MSQLSFSAGPSMQFVLNENFIPRFDTACRF